MKDRFRKSFKKLYEKGDIYNRNMKAGIAKPCESFFTESQIVDGKCPDCGAPVEKAAKKPTSA